MRKPIPRMSRVQTIGILADELNGIGAVGLVEPHRTRRADPVAVQEQHDLADDLLVGPARDDPLRALGPIPVTSRRRLGSL
jgi:hypothetical protein